MKGEENMAQINNVVVGTKYVDRKDKEGKRICTVIEVNTKTKTVMVEFEDGKSRPYVVTNFLKSFKKLEADAEHTEEKIEPVKVEKSEVKKADAETKKVTSEIINQAEAKEEAEKKQKKEKKAKKSKKVDNSVEVSKLVEYVIKNVSDRKDCSVGVPREEAMRFRALRWNGRQFCKLMWSGKNIRLYFRCEIDDVAKIVKQNNYNLPNFTEIDKFSEESKTIINKLFDKSLAYEQSLKKEKAEKKPKKTAKQTESKPAEKTE